MTYKYTCKKTLSIVYILLISVNILLTMGKWFSVFNSDFVVINSEIHSHISNFSLSMILYLGIGYLWLLSGVKFRLIVFLGVFMIIGNFICETLIGFMNTPDIIDAVYGTIGIVIAFAYLFITNKYGLIPVKSEKI